MLANPEATPSQINVLTEHLAGVSTHALRPALSLVEYNISQKAPPRAPSQRRGKARNKGGWPSSKHLKWNRDCKRIFECFHAFRRAQVQPTLFVTITPSLAQSPAAAKRQISRTLGHLGELLGDRGCAHIGLTVYEVSSSGVVHAHHAVFVPPRLKSRVQRWAAKGRVDERDARPFIPERHIGYMTKQRQPLPPEFKPLVYGKPHRWEPGGFIPGPRWSLTGPARQIVGGHNAP